MTAVLDRNDAAITNGLFTVTLDFPGAFEGNARWLEIAVRPGVRNAADISISMPTPVGNKFYRLRFP